MTLRITTLSIMTLSIESLFATINISDTCIVSCLVCLVCHVFILSVVMLNVIMQSVVVPRAELVGRNTPAYLSRVALMKKVFITLTPGACTIKLFTAVIVAVS